MGIVAVRDIGGSMSASTPRTDDRPRTETSAPMTRREIEDARDHLKAWFPNQSVERHTFNRICDQAVRSLKLAVLEA